MKKVTVRKRSTLAAHPRSAAEPTGTIAELVGSVNGLPADLSGTALVVDGSKSVVI